HLHVAPSSSEMETARLFRALSVSLDTSAQWPFFNTITSAPEPGFGSSLSTTGLQVSPRSAELLTWRRFGGGPLSRIYATSIPSFFLTTLGWILPPATSGVLVRHVPPQLSLIAIRENEKPSE